MSKYLITLAAAGCLLFGGALLAQTSAQPSVAVVGETFTRNVSRPCIFGSWVELDVDNDASTASAELNAWSTYVVQCDDDVYIQFGGSTVTAATDDGWQPGGSWLRFVTTNELRYFAILNKNADDTKECHYIECQ